MSNGWGLKCEQCGDISPKWWPNTAGREELREVVRLWPLIDGLRKVTDPLAHVSIRIVSYVPGDSVDEFLWNHYDHGALVLCDETDHTEPLEIQPAEVSGE